LKTRLETIGDVDLLQIEGHVNASATGPLCDLLVARARSGRNKLIVELAEGVDLARPGVRGLVVAAKLMQVVGRKFAIVASPELGDWLHQVSFVHLLPVHYSKADALAAMAETSENATTTVPLAVNHRTPPTSRMLPLVASKPF